MKAAKGMLEYVRRALQIDNCETAIDSDGNLCRKTTDGNMIRLFALDGFVARKGKGSPAYDRYLNTWIVAGQASRDNDGNVLITCGKWR